jgi:hypothetical protein
VAEDPLAAEALLAELNVAHVRRLRDVHVRWACITSLPLWLQAFVHRVPGAVCWLAVLAQGYAVALAIAYGVLAARWVKRSTVLRSAAESAVVHAARAGRDGVRSALWSGLAMVSLVPWGYAVLHRPWLPELRAGLTALAVSLFLLLVLLETAAELIGWHLRRARRAGPHL